MNYLFQYKPGGPFPIANHRASVNPLWELTDINLAGVFSGIPKPLMFSVNGNLIMFGRDNRDKKIQVMALDGATGNSIWRYLYNGSSFAVSPSAVFIGGIGEVISLDINNGQVIWKTNHLDGRGVGGIVIDGTMLNVNISGMCYLIDARTGSILADNTSCLYWVGPQIDNVLYQEKEEEVLTGFDRILAVDQSNGAILWKAHVNGISNLAATESNVYFLTEEGDVMQMDSSTGKAKSIVKFTSTPLNIQHDLDVFFYHVAVDADKNILFVYLGDSEQLFAFPISE